MIRQKMNNNTSYQIMSAGWFSMLFGSLTLSEWAVVVGMLATILSFLVNWHYKHLDYKLKKQEINKHGNIKDDKK